MEKRCKDGTSTFILQIKESTNPLFRNEEKGWRTSLNRLTPLTPLPVTRIHPSYRESVCLQLYCKHFVWKSWQDREPLVTLYETSHKSLGRSSGVLVVHESVASKGGSYKVMSFWTSFVFSDKGEGAWYSYVNHRWYTVRVQGPYLRLRQ